ncbi:MAG TPA: glutaredoxin domain-containing protein [Sphingomicrobium sp.]
MRKATLYRMVLPDHVCPYGVQALQMLEHAGFDVEEHLLSTRMEADAFMRELGVDTTPQVFIDGLRIGGCDELAVYLAELEEAA